MKLRFEKRAWRREIAKIQKGDRYCKNRHDRAWLLGPGQYIHGKWYVVSGLWSEAPGGGLECISSGQIRLQTKLVPGANFMIWDSAKTGENLRVFSNEKA